MVQAADAAKVRDSRSPPFRERLVEEVLPGGKGKLAVISRDLKTGELHAAPHNRNNDDAVAF